jgi:hypothetical protein
MHTVTDAFNAACSAPGREITSKVNFNGTTDLPASEIQEIVVTEQFGSSDGVTIGAAFSSSCKVTFYKQDNLPLNGAYFIPSVGIMVGGEAQYVQKGKYYIPSDGVEDSGKLCVTVTGYDRMAGLTEDYMPTITFPATPTQVLADVCKQASVTPPTVTMPSIQIAAPYTGTLRQQLGWLAGLIGCNAKFDATGNLVFCWYTDTGLTIGRDTQHMDGLTLTSENAFTINSLLTGTKENPISVGAGVGIVATNPYMTEDVAADVFAKISGKAMMPCKINWRGNPALEAGDAVTVIGLDGTTELTAYIMEQRLTVKGGMSAESSCYSPDNTDTAVQSPTEQKFQRMYDSLKKGYQDATDKIIGADGGNYSITLNKDGYPTGWTLRDTPTVEDITRMWIMSIGGLGFSKDGGKTISNIALTMDGQVVADSITTGTLTTVKIQSADGKSTWNLSTGEMDLYNTKITTSAQGSTFVTADYTEDDLARLRNLILNQVSPTLNDYEKLDVDGDGRFTAVDLLYVRQAIDGTQEINFTTGWEFALDPTDGENLLKLTKTWHNNLTSESTEHLVLGAGFGNVRVNALSIADSPIIDFVIEQGTSDIWTYQKWNSGLLEYWGREQFLTLDDGWCKSSAGPFTILTSKPAITSVTFWYGDSTNPSRNAWSGVITTGGVYADGAISIYVRNSDGTFASGERAFNYYVRAWWK